ncbi:VanZ family protein [Sansalvadorimonas verongulae]|nr:VanZ family protein [Sansalvadorimonas verongulae]
MPASYQRFAQICLPIALIAITTFALIPPDDVPLATLGDKVLHITAFFTLAGIVDAAWPHSRWNWKKMALLTSYGLAIEIAQSFHPLRTFALDDLAADVIGQLLYLALTPLFQRIPVLRLRWQHKPQ